MADINLATLTNAQGFRIIGEIAGDGSGYSVTGVGDINKDGFADIIVGAPWIASNTGRSYAIFGKASGFHDISLNAITVAQGFKIFGENAKDYSGISVSGAGDINGDGFMDIIIGANGALSVAGKGYIIFGKANGFSNISLSALTVAQGFRILGETSLDYSGRPVSGAGDVNGDGYTDVILGAPQFDTPTKAGKSYVVFGKASGFKDMSLSTLTAVQGFRIYGEHAGDCSGFPVSGAGDVNGDGYADAVIGAYNATSDAGKSYVIFGKTSGFSDIDLSVLSITQGFRILGENTGDISGCSVSRAGDINGDGYADIIIGAPYATSNTGKSYIIFGKASGFSDINGRIRN